MLRQRQWRGALCAGVLMLVSGLLSAEEMKRVISADGAITEIIYALNAEEMLVGVDTTSVYPPQAKQLPSLGYRRTLTAEGMLSLHPDVILATSESGPEATINRMRNSGVQVVQLPDILTPADLIERVGLVGAQVNRLDQARLLQIQLEQKVANLQAQAFSGDEVSVLFLLAAGSRGIMVAGQQTQAQRVLDTLGIRNAAVDIVGYRPFNQESVLAMRPQLILVAETHAGAFDLSAWPALSATPAVLKKQILVLDSMYLLGGGTRWPDALSEVLAFTQKASEDPYE